MNKNTAAEMFCGLIVLLFVYTGISKLLDHSLFQHQLAAFPLIGRMSSILWWLIPIAELIIATLVIYPKTRLRGLWYSIVLLFCFSCYLVIAIIKKGRDLPCSCGGVLRYMSWKQHVAFNVLFIALAIISIVITKRNMPNTFIKK
jgi:putative oxidoreductase